MDRPFDQEEGMRGGEKRKLEKTQQSTEIPLKDFEKPNHS